VAEQRLLEVALASSLTPSLQRRLAGGDFLSLNSVAEAGQPFAGAILGQLSGRPVLIVVDGPRTQDAFLADLQAFVPSALPYPAWETLPHEDILPNEQTIADRLTVLSSLITPNSSFLLVATVPALLQRTFSPAAFRRERFTLAVGQSLELQALSDRLLALGYSPQIQVGEPGDMAVRGGLVDFYPLDANAPVRVEFLGDEIASIRTFDPVTQQSREKLDRIESTVAGEVGFLKKAPDQSAPLTAYLPANTLLVLVEPDALALAAAAYTRQVPDDDPFHVTWPHWLEAGLQTVQVTEQIAPDEDAAHLNLRLASLEAYRPLDTRQPDPEIATQLRRAFFDQLQRWLVAGYRLHAFCDTDGEKQRFEELWKEHNQPVILSEAKDLTTTAHRSREQAEVLRSAQNDKIEIAIAPLTRGFIWDEAKLCVVTDGEIFGRYKQHRPRRKGYTTAPVADWHEFTEGDFVVHLDQGVGKYLGIRQVDRQEVLAIGYANDARLYVPLDQAHLVSKYVGLGKRIPELHELGGAKWGRQKLSAERAIMDLASQLLEIQAARGTLPGHAFAPDTPWQREFEAAFPFEETPDQDTAIEDTKSDMETAKPMDRLICGDVGYGKTEVAIRAAFKAVMDGFQVAILCPTTILAEQHWNVFRQRMAGFPVTIEMLSRFRTPAEQKKAVKLLREGGVDIIIGTHRLLSADIAFKNLGLVVIDEEQRFGVLHKEKFKQFRKLVDVLTLSATPIPRTLYMALTGARDMSVIQTPPVNRLPVETHIAPYDERLIRQVIQRELARGGQVFYLHNRVQSIDAVAERLDQLFDGQIRIDVGHGQMHERELETVMHRFVAGKVDVLVCTTIIESGLDIPNANTIIIDRADRFGLADLYQLRGRVGRYNRQAYAYILLPRHMQLIATARKRISAIKQYSSLGSGYKIAMRDLEIRGAGNLLGAEQSGHITSIGFELYCQLLKESVARLKGEKIKRTPRVTLKLDFLLPPCGSSLPAATGEPLARIPETYIPDSRLRIEAYRKIAQITDLADTKALRAELRDRYGKLPRPADLLLAAAELKVVAAAAGVDTVETKDGKIMLSRTGHFYQIGGKFPRLNMTKPENKLTEIQKLIESLPTS
jgi:transcription-repair coupling factor (superfamily II helicase)